MHPAAPFTVEDDARAAGASGGASVRDPGARRRRAGRWSPRRRWWSRRLAGGLALDFHLSRGNALAPFLATGFRAVAVSLAADAYVSPDWYESADQVPTWNYRHGRGRRAPIAALSDAELVALLDDLSAAGGGAPAPQAALDARARCRPGRFEAMLRGIVGAPADASSGWRRTFKLSQNKRPPSCRLANGRLAGERALGCEL